MDFILKEVPICADKEFEMIKITDDVRKVVEESGVEKGIVYVITEHTTTGITVNESLPCVEKDLMECLDRIAPEDYPYHHNHYLPTYGTIGGNAPGHLKSLLTGNHCVFPVLDGTLKLGHAVDIYFCEYDGIKNRRYNLSTLVMGTQTGTHVDAPYHFSNSGETIDNMELDFFLGEAVVVRVTDKKADEAITLEDIEPYKEEICEGKIVLFNTNWYKTRGTDEFFHHPYVNGDVAKYLVDNGVRFIGIDTINADQTGGTEFPVHDLFSEKRLMIGENWAFFDQIDFERPYVIALPMKLIGCDGSPVRAIAVQWEEE